MANARTCFIVALTLFEAVAHAQAEPSNLEAATELVKKGKADQSLAIVDPIIERAMQGAAKDAKAICPGVAAAYLQAFMKGKATVSVTDDWCEAMLIKAYALNELKRPQDAEQLLEKLIGHNPDNPQYLVEYAYTVRLNGKLERSLNLYEKAERLASRLADRTSAAHWRAAALRGQGFAYIDLNRWDEAAKAYERSLKYEPDNRIAQAELAYIKETRPQ